jgi:hypothetical protein
MGNFIDLSGKQFGRLTVIGRVSGVGETKKILWRCRCECGTELDVNGDNLKSKNSKGCGNHRGYSVGLSMQNVTFYSYKRNAQTRGIDFNITKDKFAEITSKNCFYCGLPPQLTPARKHYKKGLPHNGLDRLDNSGGYNLENVVPCCKTCNYAKHTLSYGDFMSWIFRMIKSVSPLMRFGGRYAERTSL